MICHKRSPKVPGSIPTEGAPSYVHLCCQHYQIHLFKENSIVYFEAKAIDLKKDHRGIIIICTRGSRIKKVAVTTVNILFFKFTEIISEKHILGLTHEKQIDNHCKVFTRIC